MGQIRLEILQESLVEYINARILAFGVEVDGFDFLEDTVFPDFFQIEEVFEQVVALQFEELIQVELFPFCFLVVLGVVVPQINIEENFAPDVVGEVIVEVLEKFHKNFEVPFVIDPFENTADEVVEDVF